MKVKSNEGTTERAVTIIGHEDITRLLSSPYMHGQHRIPFTIHCEDRTLWIADYTHISGLIIPLDQIY